MNTLRIFALSLALGAAGCSDERLVVGPDASNQPDAQSDASEPTPVTECTTSVTLTGGGAPTWVELCEVDGGARHVRVEGASAPRHHASYQIFVGLAEPIGAQDELEPGVFKLQLYGGG